MSSVNQVPDRTDEPNDPVQDEKRKGPAQASTQRRVAGRLLQTLRSQTPLNPTAQRMQEVANKSAQQASAIKSEIQSAKSRFEEGSKRADDALCSFAEDLMGTRVQPPDLTASFAKLCLADKPVQPKEPAPTKTALERLNSDPAWAYKRANIEQNMAVAQMGAAVVHATGDFVKWNVKKFFFCEHHNGCRTVLNFAKETGKAALDAVGLKEPVKKFLTPPPSLAAELDRQFSIPKELADQYAQNSMTVTMSLIPVPPVLRMGKWATSKISQAAKAAQETAKRSRASYYYNGHLHEVIKPTTAKPNTNPSASSTVTEGVWRDVPTPTKPFTMPRQEWKNSATKTQEVARSTHPPMDHHLQTCAIENDLINHAFSSTNRTAVSVSLTANLRPYVPLTPYVQNFFGQVTCAQNADSALIVIAETAASLPASSRTLTQAKEAHKCLDQLAEELQSFAKDRRLQRIKIAYNEKQCPVLTAFNKRTDEILSIGTFHVEGNPEPLTLIEIRAGDVPLPPPHAPTRYPEKIIKDLTGTVKGHPSTPMAFAVDNLELEQLFPEFTITSTQEKLWPSIIKQYHQPLTSKAEVRYLKDVDHGSDIVAKITDREHHAYIVEVSISPEKIIRKLQGNDLMRSYNLKNINTPIVYAAGRYELNGVMHYFIIESCVEGHAIMDTMKEIGALPIESPERKELLSELTRFGATPFGKGLGEQQQKGFRKKQILQPRNVDIYVTQFEDQIQLTKKALKGANLGSLIDFEAMRDLFAWVVEEFKQSPMPLTGGLGNIGASQIVWNRSKTPHVAYIDSEMVTSCYGVTGRPLTPVGQQFASAVHMLERNGLQRGLLPDEIQSLQTALRRAHDSEFKETSPVAPLRFFHLKESLHTLECLADDLAAGRPVHPHHKESLLHFIEKVKQEISLLEAERQKTTNPKLEKSAKKADKIVKKIVKKPPAAPVSQKEQAIALENEVKSPQKPPLHTTKMVVRAVDEAVEGNQSSRLHFAIEGIEAERFLPNFANEHGQERLWLEVIEKYSGPLSSEPIYTYFSNSNELKVVKISDTIRSVIVKDKTSAGEIVNEVRGIDFVDSLKLRFLHFPTLIAAGKYIDQGHERYFYCTSFFAGRTIAKAMKKIGSYPLDSLARKAKVERLELVAGQFGKGFAELQSKRVEPNRTRTITPIAALEELIHRTNKLLEDIGMSDAIDLYSYQAAFDVISANFTASPGTVAYGIGSNIDSTQFAFSADSHPSVAYLDAGNVTRQLGVSKEPLTPVCDQYYRILHMFSSEGLLRGLTLEEVRSLQGACASGYESEFPDIAPSPAARFYDLYHALKVICCLAEAIANKKPIPKETLGALIGEVKQRLG